MKRDSIHLIHLVLLFVVFTFYSCTNQDNTNPANGLTSSNGGASGIVYTENPIENVGMDHNFLYIHLIDNNTISNYHLDVLPTSWPDTTYFNRIAMASDEYVNTYGLLNDASVTITNNPTYFHWMSKLSNISLMANDFKKAIQQSTVLSDRDRAYGLEVCELSDSIRSLDFGISYCMQRILDLENKILAVSWNNNESFALFSISLLKYDFTMHATELSYVNDFPKKEKKPNKDKNKQKKGAQSAQGKGQNTASSAPPPPPPASTDMSAQTAAEITSDYIVGAAVFLSEVGATAGVATPVAVGTGIVAGGSASGAVGMVGRWLGLWN